MQRNLRLRADVNRAMREAMAEQGFVEIETPMLIASTPEGARDFVVPSRLSPGKFYALPQSPQLFKQLLMVGGFDRYFQIARCLRDEDLRADRQFEFMQLDVEMTFADQEDVLDAVSVAVLAAAEAARPGEAAATIPRITWHDAMERYGSDKPDVRFGMELVELTEVFVATEFRAFAGVEAVKGLCVAGEGDLVALPARRADGSGEVAGRRGSRVDARARRWRARVAGREVPVGSRADRARRRARRAGGRSASWSSRASVRWRDRCSGSCASTSVARRCPRACSSCGSSTSRCSKAPTTTGVRSPRITRSRCRIPTTSNTLESSPLTARSQAYDLVLNGWELGSGSVRIHRPDIQQRIFSMLGIEPEDAQERFGFLLDAFRFGAPPHAGFAVGIDRFVAILAGEENIREVIAFPKTQSGIDPLTNAPTGDRPAPAPRARPQPADARRAEASPNPDPSRQPA